jgi:hypothetical protein
MELTFYQQQQQQQRLVLIDLIYDYLPYTTTEAVLQSQSNDFNLMNLVCNALRSSINFNEQALDKRGVNCCQVLPGSTKELFWRVFKSQPSFVDDVLLGDSSIQFYDCVSLVSLLGAQSLLHQTSSGEQIFIAPCYFCHWNWPQHSDDLESLIGEPHQQHLQVFEGAKVSVIKCLGDYSYVWQPRGDSCCELFGLSLPGTCGLVPTSNLQLIHSISLTWRDSSQSIFFKYSYFHFSVQHNLLPNEFVH